MRDIDLMLYTVCVQATQATIDGHLRRDLFQLVAVTLAA